jgi:hypothetical protein
MHELVDTSEGTKLAEQIRLIESYPGAAFLSAASLIAEIGDFSAFQSPKQLFAYLGLDTAVRKSGKWEGTKISMSKRGSAVARRVIHMMAMQGISRNRDGSARNPVLRDYYEQKCRSKPKKVALGAVMHKVCNIVFAILRDEKAYRIVTPQEHRQNYLIAKCGIAA